MKKTTIVKNVITEEKQRYFNSYSLEENLISAIILTNNESSNLLNTKVRKKYGKDVELISSKKGDKVAYSEKYDLIAYKENHYN